MKEEYDNRNRISIFKNDKEDNPRRPDYTGTLNADGSDYYVSLWIRESKKGTKYMSGEVKIKDDGLSKPKATSQPSLTGATIDLDDDIPF